MRLEDVAAMDFAKMTPQQRSHLRKRLGRAGIPIPRGLASKRGAAAIPAKDGERTTSAGPEGYDCTVVESNGAVRVYHISPDSP